MNPEGDFHARGNGPAWDRAGRSAISARSEPRAGWSSRASSWRSDARIRSTAATCSSLTATPRLAILRALQRAASPDNHPGEARRVQEDADGRAAARSSRYGSTSSRSAARAYEVPIEAGALIVLVGAASINRRRRSCPFSTCRTACRGRAGSRRSTPRFVLRRVRGGVRAIAGRSRL